MISNVSHFCWIQKFDKMGNKIQVMQEWSNINNSDTILFLFGMWDVQDVRCSGCDIFRMWDVWDVEYSGCGMFGMWYVRDVGCGMWDLCSDVGCWFTKCHLIAVLERKDWQILVSDSCSKKKQIKLSNSRNRSYSWHDK